jgi:adenylate cyclase
MITPTLRVLRLDGSEELFPLDGDSVTVGKDYEDSGISNDLKLEDATVSRRHARLTREGVEWWIADLGSRNHTFVNDERVEKQRLVPGDRIGIGLTTIYFDAPRAESIDTSDAAIKSDQLDPSRTVDLNYIILERLSEAVAKAADPDEFFHAVLELTVKSIRTDRACILLVQPDSSFEERAFLGTDGNPDLEAVRSAAATRHSEIGERREAGHPVRRTIAAPLVRDGRTVAVLLLESSRRAFDANDLTLATAVANQAAAGLERLMLIARVREETLVRSSLERFFSPAVAAKIARESGGISGLTLRPEKVDASILFTDIRSFTRLTERFSATEIAEILRDHFSLLTDIVFAHGGILDKFIGDSIMAVFGPPEGSAGHAARAVECALDILESHECFKAEQPGSRCFDIRIGVNSGSVVAGYFGSPRRMEYTVLGNPVVIAKRLESLAPPNGVLVGQGACEAYEADGGEGLIFTPAPGIVEPKSGEILTAFVPTRRRTGQ